MGLDSYWTHPDWKDDDGQLDDDEIPSPDLEGEIVGGMLSGHGCGSFRGKVYNPFIETVTGVSLYQDRIPNDTIHEMASKLGALSWEEAQEVDTSGTVRNYDNPITEEEFDELVEMFQFYANKGAALKGWW